MSGQLFVWNGRAMVPTTGAGTYKKGEVYLLREEGRVEAARRHYHARVAELWDNLPHDEFPSPTHLRKFALIRTGFCQEITMPLATEGLQALFKILARRFDPYVICVSHGESVAAYTAKSQARGSMRDTELSDSMAKVLDYAEGLLERKVQDDAE
jgi:hypothetical protein